jgi:hypothetical protein
MGRARRSENLRRGALSPGGGTEEARRGVGSFVSELPGWETSEVCTTPCTTTSVPAAGKLRLASGSEGDWEGSGGVAGLSITLNASELSRLRSPVWSSSRGVDGRGAGSWLRARRSRGGEDDEADRGSEEGEGETSVAVLWGTKSGWETSMVEEPEEEGPREAGLGTSVELADDESSFALPFWSLAIVFDGCEEGADGIRARDGPLSWDSSCSGCSCNNLVGSLANRRRRSKVQRLCVLETVSRSPSLGGVRLKQLRMGERSVPRKERRRLRLSGREG